MKRIQYCAILFLIFSICFSIRASCTGLSHAATVVGGIKIKGNFPLFEKELRRVIDIRIGEEYSEAKAAEVTAKIEKLYHDEGYENARVEHALEEMEEGVSILIFTIHKGPRTRIGTISITDDRPNEKPDIHFALGIMAGQVFNRRKFKLRLKALEERLVRYGYLRADVRYLEKIQDNSAHLNIFVYRGARLTVRIEGNLYFTDDAILNVITFYENRFFDRIEAEESVEQIKGLYQDNGFIDVQVDVTWSAPDMLGDREVVFSIREGERAYLDDVRFEHSGFIRKKRIKRQFLSLRTWSIFRARPFKAITFEKDIDALGALYRSEGFPNVRISITTEREGGYISKRVVIQEGTRVMVRRISLEGNTAFAEQTLKGLMSTAEGAPLRPKEFQEDQRQVSVFYTNKGYPYARVTARIERDEETGSADIFYTIEEGPYVRFGTVDIIRNIKTKEKVIRSATTFRTGEPFSYQEILDTQERLSRLGLFRSLDVEPLGIEKKVQIVDCRIEVEEMETGKVNLGGGYSSGLGYRAYMEVREDNLWGRAISGSFRADLTGLGGNSDIGSDVGRTSKYTITFRDPLFIPRHKIEGEGSIYTSTEDRKEYHFRSNGLELGVWRPYRSKLRAGLIYHIDLNRLKDITIDPSEIPEKYAEHTISAIGPTIIYDSRDNFLDPHRGVYLNAGIDWAGSWIGGDQDFYKTTGELRLFFPLTSRFVTALSVRGGYIGLYGKTSLVPIQERFFAGGGNTVRGFREDSLCPLDKKTGLPRGGRILWINNLEFRYPIYKSLQGVLFFDTGNVWDLPEDLRTDTLRQGAGGGVRWITPIGPVRLDYGRAIDRKPGESVARLYLSIGHAF